MGARAMGQPPQAASTSEGNETTGASIVLGNGKRENHERRCSKAH
jgi:hypothetical protein